MSYKIHDLSIWGALAVLALLAGQGCGDSTETGVECAANAPGIVAACPAGTRAVVDAQAQEACDGALDGSFNPIEGSGEGSVSGACTASGSCQVLCEFLEPCACGIQRISREEVICTPCGACGNDVCDPGEDAATCPQDCGGRCVVGEERCDAAERQVCNSRQQWESLGCPQGTVCRELADDQTECRQVEECTCAGVSACCDGCRARAVGEACEGGAFCQVDTTCQDDGTCGGGEDRDCGAAVTDARCQAPSCDEALDRCVALPAREGQRCEEPSTPSNDRCLEGACVAEGCQCAGVSACCDGCNPIHAGEPCDDGLFCTTDTACDARGVCAGAERDCADDLGVSSCFRVICDEDADRCAAEVDPGRQGQPCEDDLFCTVQTRCQSDGSCADGGARDCSAALTDPQCQEAPTCDEAADACVVTPAHLGEPCDDGLFCQEDTTCQDDGRCGGGQPRACGAPAEPQCQTTPTCDEALNRCTAAPRNEGLACDDNNPLTAQDACVEGVCRGVPPHAELDCSTGACRFARCQVGWDDADMDCLAGGPCDNGCEVCLPFADGTVELPDDGIDNDCMGGADPVNDESRGFYVDVAFTPAGDAPCGASPRGGRACPFTSLDAALLASDEQPWGTGQVKREIYLASGRISLTSTAEIYRPVILIGGYTPTPSGPWTQDGDRTEIVQQNASRATLYLSMDTYGMTVLDRLAIQGKLDVQGPNHGDLALLRVTRLDAVTPLSLEMPLSGEQVCGRVWMDHVSLSTAWVSCERGVLNDSLLIGSASESPVQSIFNSPGYEMHGIRNFIQDDSQGFGSVGSFSSRLNDFYFVGNTIKTGSYINISVECYSGQTECIVYGNDLEGFTFLSGNEHSRVERNSFRGGLSVGYNSSYYVSRLRLTNNLIIQNQHLSSGLVVQVAELRGNFIWMDQIGLELAAPRAINNTVILDLPYEHTAALSLGLANDEITALVDSNLFVSLGPLSTFLTLPYSAEADSIRSNVFVSAEETPFLSWGNGSVVQTLSNLNRFGGLEECGRGGNQWFSTINALGWESTLPSAAGYGVPGAESVQVDAGLTPPYVCGRVQVGAQAQDLRGNPRQCGEAVDVGALEYCP